MWHTQSCIICIIYANTSETLVNAELTSKNSTAEVLMVNMLGKFTNKIVTGAMFYLKYGIMYSGKNVKLFIYSLIFCSEWYG